MLQKIFLTVCIIGNFIYMLYLVGIFKFCNFMLDQYEQKGVTKFNDCVKWAEKYEKILDKMCTALIHFDELKKQL